MNSSGLSFIIFVGAQPARRYRSSSPGRIRPHNGPALTKGMPSLPTPTNAYVKSRRERKKIEMLFAHLKRILRLDRLRLRGPFGARDEFLLAATAQNLRKLAKLILPPALKPA